MTPTVCATWGISESPHFQAGRGVCGGGRSFAMTPPTACFESK
jgi:hypothetical protein